MHFLRSRFLNSIFKLGCVVLPIAVSACEAVALAPVDQTNTIQFSESTTFDSVVFAFATDYASSGVLYFAGLQDGETALINTDINNLGSSAMLSYSGDLVFILHDGYSLGSSDNLEVLDPYDNFATVGQWSTGNGTNPQSVATQGARAFISLYNPSADADNVDEQGSPGDVIEMSLADGSITHRYAFAGTHAHSLLASDKLYVGLQNLNPNTFAAESAGQIGIINPSEHTIEDVLTLTGRNPIQLALSADGQRLFVAEMAPYDYSTQSFNTDSEFGGLEIINLTTQTTEAFLPDEDFGGYIENIVAGDDKIYLHVSSDANGEYTSKIVELPQTAVVSSEAVLFVDPQTDIRAVTYDNGYVWLSLQKSGGTSLQIQVFDASTKEPLGDSLTPVAPVMGLAGEL